MVRGSIDEADTHRRGVRLAGMLAQAGVDTLVMQGPAAEAQHPLRARRTDLPSIVATAVPGTSFSSTDGSFRVEVHEDGLRWTAKDAATAQRIFGGPE